MEHLLSDEAIIGLYQRRDETAIPETDKKYRSYLYTIAHHILGNAEDCEECLSDTYFKTWNAIPPAIPRIFRAFLAKITRNTAFDRQDSANCQKRVPPSLCDPLTDLEDFLPGPSTEELLEARTIAKIISAYLDRLSDRQLYIFISRYYFLFPIRHIAQKLHVSQSTVNKELAAMKQELRKNLENGGIDL